MTGRSLTEGLESTRQVMLTCFVSVCSLSTLLAIPSPPLQFDHGHPIPRPDSVDDNGQDDRWEKGGEGEYGKEEVDSPFVNPWYRSKKRYYVV